jgi:hypothetical protein
MDALLRLAAKFESFRRDAKCGVDVPPGIALFTFHFAVVCYKLADVEKLHNIYIHTHIHFTHANKNGNITEKLTESVLKQKHGQVLLKIKYIITFLTNHFILFIRKLFSRASF